MNKAPIFVFVEFDGKAKLTRMSKELLTKAFSLKEKSQKEVWALSFNTVFSEEISFYGMDKMLSINYLATSYFPVEDYSEILLSLTKDYAPEIFLFPANAHGQALASRLSGMGEYGLVSTCIDVDFQGDVFVQTRPSYGENVMANIMTTSPTKLVTMQRGTVDVKKRDFREVSVLFYTPKNLSQRSLSRTLTQAVQKEKSLDEARIIVAGGRGLGSAQGFSLLEELADVLGGEIAGSRAAVDLGWISSAKQVGQTGTIVQPAIYIAIGISGAMQHIAGMRKSKCIIAVNDNKYAPIHHIADYAVLGDYKKVVPFFIQKIKDIKA